MNNKEVEFTCSYTTEKILGYAVLAAMYKKMADQMSLDNRNLSNFETKTQEEVVHMARVMEQKAGIFPNLT